MTGYYIILVEGRDDVLGFSCFIFIYVFLIENIIYNYKLMPFELISL